MSRLFWVFLIGICFHLIGVCQTAEVINANDLLSVTIESQPKLSKTYRVSEAGEITLETVGALKVIGLSAESAAQVIEDALEAKNVVADAKVEVRIIANTVYLAGALGKPGTYPITSGLRLLDAVNEAEPQPDADLTAVRLTRADGSRASYDLAKYKSNLDPLLNPVLEPGDDVFVVKRVSNEAILVLGAIKTVSSIAFREGVTAQEALDQAGGTLPDADLSQIKLTRRISGDVLVIDLRKPEGNVTLQPGDQLFVPQRVGTVYVLVKGAVKRSGLVPFEEGLTVSQAVKVADPQDDAQLKKVVLERKLENNKKQKIKVNLEAVEAGTAEDVTLQAGDEINVPYPPRKTTTAETIQLLSLLLSVGIFLLSQ